MRIAGSRPTLQAGLKARFRLLLTLLLPVLAFCWPVLAQAEVGASRYAEIVVDAANGRVLSATNPDAPRYPASLAKLMTLYLTFEALRDHRITLNTLVPVSAHAASMEPAKLGLVPGMKFTVQQAILGIVTQSANDAASALGELLGGSEPRFAQLMTLRARALGMTHTVYRNASGLPNPAQVTTARDMSILARHLIHDFPQDYHYFSVPNFVFHGRTIYNHDVMLRYYPGADGMKTGFTDAAGHTLVTSAVHDGVRLIGVVLGANTLGAVHHDMYLALNEGFARIDAPSVQVASRKQRHLPSLVASAEAATLPHPQVRLAMARLPNPPDAVPLDSWTVQVGAFPSYAAARRAAKAAHARHGGGVHLEPTSYRGHKLWRAQLIGLPRLQAHRICALRGRRHLPCEVLAPRRVASR